MTYKTFDKELYMRTSIRSNFGQRQQNVAQGTQKMVVESLSADFFKPFDFSCSQKRVIKAPRLLTRRHGLEERIIHGPTIKQEPENTQRW